MTDDDHSSERAAIWYVGAFATLGSVLLAGVSIAGVDWTHAPHPVQALVLVGAAIVAAFTVVTLASRVIAPGCTSVTLTKRTDRVRKRLQRRNRGAPVTWEDIASEDKGVLRALFVDEAAFNSSPATLWAGAKSGDATDQATLKAMVDAANSWLARRRFIVLRYVTPVAALIVLIGGLAWKPLTAPQQTHNVTSTQPSSLLTEQLLVLKGQQTQAREQLRLLEAQNGLLKEQTRLLTRKNWHCQDDDDPQQTW